MATEIKTWEIIDGELTEINTTLAQNGRKEKDDLEKWLKTNPKILGDNILVFGEQVWTKSGPLDYLGIDNNGLISITAKELGVDNYDNLGIWYSEPYYHRIDTIIPIDGAIVSKHLPGQGKMIECKKNFFKKIDKVCVNITVSCEKHENCKKK